MIHSVVVVYASLSSHHFNSLILKRQQDKEELLNLRQQDKEELLNLRQQDKEELLNLRTEIESAKQQIQTSAERQEHRRQNLNFCLLLDILERENIN